MSKIDKSFVVLKAPIVKKCVKILKENEQNVQKQAIKLRGVMLFFLFRMEHGCCVLFVGFENAKKKKTIIQNNKTFINFTHHSLLFCNFVEKQDKVLYGRSLEDYLDQQVSDTNGLLGKRQFLC